MGSASRAARVAARLEPLLAEVPEPAHEDGVQPLAVGYFRLKAMRDLERSAPVVGKQRAPLRKR